MSVNFSRVSSIKQIPLFLRVIMNIQEVFLHDDCSFKGGVIGVLVIKMAPFCHTKRIKEQNCYLWRCSVDSRRRIHMVACPVELFFLSIIEPVNTAPTRRFFFFFSFTFLWLSGCKMQEYNQKNSEYNRRKRGSEVYMFAQNFPDKNIANAFKIPFFIFQIVTNLSLNVQYS